MVVIKWFRVEAGGVGMLICVTGPGWDRRTAESRAAEFLTWVPRTAVGGEGVVWADGGGLDATAAARSIHEHCRSRGEEAWCGVAPTVSAALAASQDRTESGGVVVVVSARAYLRDRPVGVLGVSERLRQLLEGVGIETCGELAAVEAEAVEVRFGPESLDPWRWSRGEDPRRVFRSSGTTRPQASLDFVDYVVTDPERLAFTANGLLSSLCEQLAKRGSHARRMELVLPLANGESWRKVLRPARPTASRAVWLRQVRRILEQLTVPDAVAGMSIEVLDTEAAAAVQGDLFDAGFATAGAVEAALSRVVEQYGPVVVRMEATAHALAESRTSYVALDAETVAIWSGTPPGARGLAGTRARPWAEENSAEVAGLTLQLLPEPRPIAVETVERRDHDVPVRYRDGEWTQIVQASGPDRVSGGQWERAYAREYFRALTADGRLVWIYRDGQDRRWYLHGWWD